MHPSSSRENSRNESSLKSLFAFSAKIEPSEYIEPRRMHLPWADIDKMGLDSGKEGIGQTCQSASYLEVRASPAGLSTP